MRVAYDLAAMESKGSGRRGIGRYTLELGKAIQAELLANGDEFLALDYAVDWEMLPEVRRCFGQSQLRHVHTPQPRGRHGANEDALRPAGAELVADYYKTIDVDVIYVGSLFEGFETSLSLPVTYRGTGKLVVATFYDLIPLVFAEKYLNNQEYRKWYYSCLDRAKSCDLLLSISEATRQDAIRLLHIDPERIVTIGGGIDSRFRNLPYKTDEAILRRYGIRDKFVMDIGTVEWTKNFPRLIDGWGRLSPELRHGRQLVLICNNEYGQEGMVREMACRCGIRPDEVIVTGYVPDDDLVELYNACELFVFPSLYEGLGFPPLEAMRCGAVVMGADNSSLTEVIGNQEALFDAEDPENIADAIARGLTDDDLRARLREWGSRQSQKYTWCSAARTTVQAMRESLSKKWGIEQ